MAVLHPRLLSDFEEWKALEGGAFGYVIKARHKDDKCLYAIKQMPTKLDDYKKAMKEVKAMARLDHPNIVRYFATWTERPDAKEESAYIAELEKNIIGLRELIEKNSDDSDDSDDESMETNKDKVKTERLVEVSSNQETDSVDERRMANLSIQSVDDTLDLYESEEDETDDNAEKTENNDIVVENNTEIVVTQTHRSNPTLKEEAKTEDAEPRIYIYLQMQLCPQGSLLQWFRKNKTYEKRPIVKLWKWFRQLIKALDYIHKKRLIHRDIKSANIFLFSKNILKLGDLGCITAPEHTFRQTSRFSGRAKKALSAQSRTSDVGSELYWSPEQLKQLEANEYSETISITYSAKVDVYALGAVFAEMLLPLQSEDEINITLGNLQRGILPIKPDNSPYKDEAFKFLAWLCKSDPKERPSSADVETFRMKPDGTFYSTKRLTFS